MADGETDPRVVVSRDRRQRPILAGAVDQDDRDSRLRQLREIGRRPPGGGENQTVDAAVEHGAEHSGFLLGVVVRVGQDQRVVGLPQGVLDPPDDGREQRIGEVGQQHPDGEGPVGLQAPGERIGLVPEGLRRLQNPGYRFLVDEGPRLRVEGARSR